MIDKLDIVLFGATGYTGKFTMAQLQKFSKNFTWGVAGRSEEKLKKALAEVGMNNVHTQSTIPIILASAEDEASIKRMAARAKVIINCCGHYDLFGEVVVKACTEMGTHYVDVTAETQFIDRMIKKYSVSAEKNGVYIVHACGIGYIVSDLGICFMENNWKGTIDSVKIYMFAYREDDVSTLEKIVNFGTWVSMVNFIKAMNKSNMLRRCFSQKLLEKTDGGWALIFPSPDLDVVERSQQFFCQQFNKRCISMHNYAVLKTFKNLIIAFIFLLIAVIFGQFRLGRYFLLKFPEFFTYGTISHQPIKERMDGLRFTLTFKGQGWTKKLQNSNEHYNTPPNKEFIGVVSGCNPAYGFTSLAVTLSALTILTEFKNLPVKGGVYTPAMAFSQTSLIQQLQNNGVVFKILSVNDI